ncbi:MAG: hypothetical protein ACOX39_08330 [Arcobacteraceae bacterium]|jgi:hypothetical protein|nr:hypothetical protein [Arcobacteraceae bacterium]
MNNEHIISKLLTLFFSGVYISSKDLLDIAQALDIQIPAKSRELLLKNIFAKASEDGKISQLYDLLIALLQQRVYEYKSLTINYPHIQIVSHNWINKAGALIRLLQQQKRGSIYE